jgi:hypothetical protein
MSGLATLPPDQRAVLQLILKQGRGYDDLAGLLKIDATAVRDRALAGLDALAPEAGRGLAPERRDDVGDYLLGQQDEAARAATRAHLAVSAAARDWAQALHAELAPVARDPLPEVPVAAVATNGGGTTTADTSPAEPAAAAGTPAPLPPRPTPKAPPRRSSRLGGALLIGGVAIVLAVLVIVLVNRGGSDNGPSAAVTPTTAAQTGTGTTTSGATSTTPTIFGQANLNPTAAGGQARGIGYVVPTPDDATGRTLALQINKMPANANDAYAVWLRSANGSTHLLGYSQSAIRKNGGTLAVTAALPSNYERYDEVLVTRESRTAAATRPGPVVASGPLKLR